MEIIDLTESFDGIVLCDLCCKDYSNSDESGGFLFVTKAVCPSCAPNFLRKIKECNESNHIKSKCPDNISFKDYVLSLR